MSFNSISIRDMMNDTSRYLEFKAEYDFANPYSVLRATVWLIIIESECLVNIIEP